MEKFLFIYTGGVMILHVRSPMHTSSGRKPWKSELSQALTDNELMGLLERHLNRT